MTIIFNGTTGIAGAGSVTGMTVANTAVSGLITAAQIASVANTQVTGTITSSQLDSTVNALFPYTNKIINGDFRIWQRGTSFSGVSSGQYTADRWMISYRTAGVTVAQQNNQYYQAARLTNTDASVQSFDFEQRIEDTSQFSNTTYTLSFYAKSSTNVTVAAQCYANYGSGGSAQDTVNVVNCSVTTTRTRFTVPLVFPDMSAKTIASTSWVRILLSPSSLPSNAWVEYDSVQINYGSTALPFQTRHIQQELALCQRYFEIVRNAVANGYNGSLAIAAFRYAVVKRAAPTLTLPGVGNLIGNSQSFTPTSFGADDNAVDSLSTDVYASGLSGTQSYNWRAFSLWAAAEL
jgi:hypothetical protein